MSAVLATIPDEVARRVADDVRDFGHGYVRIDSEGRATFVPSYLVLEPVRDRDENRMHE